MLLATIVLLTIVAVIPAGQVQFDNSIEAWFLEGDPELAIYNRFSERFKANEIAVLAVFHDDIFDVSTLSLVDRITNAAAGLDNVFRVISITNSELTQRLDGGFLGSTFRDEVLASPPMKGTLVSPDGTAASIIVYYSRTGVAFEDRHRFAAALEEIAIGETQGTTINFALAGAPVIANVGQSRNERDIRILVPIMILVILVISFAVFRSVWLSLVPLLVVGIAVIWSIGFMGIVGWKMTMLSTMLMPLILAVGVADSIHVITRFRDHVARGSDRVSSVKISLARLLKPCFFTTCTTIIGLLALLVSNIEPVRQFGVGAAVGVLVAFLVSITLVPALLIMIPTVEHGDPAHNGGTLGRFLSWVNQQSRDHGRFFISLTLVVVVACTWLATRVTVGLDPMTWFPEKDPYRIGSEKIDQTFGGSLTMEFLVTSADRDLNEPAVLRRLERFETWLLENTDITRTSSMVDLVKEAARVVRGEGAAGYTLPRTQLVIDALLDGLQRSGQLDGWVQPDFSSARISARIPLTQTRNIVQQAPVILEHLQAGFSEDDLQVQMTGHAVLVARMQNYVVRSQVLSLSVAIIAISLLMFVIMRSVSLGLLAMIPNLLPIIAGLSAMTIFGVDLNPGTVMITAVALGIVVDDTVHFMTAVRRELQHTNDISLATERAVTEVGRPIVVTSVLLVLGFSVLLLGSFLPIQQLGGILALIIVVALFADLLLLPVVLRHLPVRLLV